MKLEEEAPKTVLERKAPPTFELAVEMLERAKWVVHDDVAETVDQLLRRNEPVLQIRTINSQGEVEKTEEAPPQFDTAPRQRCKGTKCPR